MDNYIIIMFIIIIIFIKARIVFDHTKKNKINKIN